MNYTISRPYVHPEHSECRLHVGLRETYDRKELWKHTPASVDEDPIHPDIEKQLRPAQFRVADQVIADVVLELPDGQHKRRHASIFREAHTMGLDDGWQTSTSCAIKDEVAVRKDRQNGGYTSDHWMKQDREMLWDYSSESWETVDDLLEQLCASADVIFESEYPTDIRYSDDYDGEFEHL